MLEIEPLRPCKRRYRGEKPGESPDVELGMAAAALLGDGQGRGSFVVLGSWIRGL